MRNRHLQLFLFLILTLFLSSCLTVTSGMNHQNSGSGQLSLEYRLNKKAIGIQKDSLGERNLIPLPVNQEDFNEVTALIPGITLRSFSESEDDQFVYIESEIDYQSLDDLSRFLGFPMEFSTNGSVNSLTMYIYEAEEALNSDTQAILDSVFADDSLVFEFTFPRNIQSSTYGSVSGRNVSYTVNLPAVYRQGNFVWTLEW